MDDVEHWYALIDARSVVESFLEGTETDADVVRRYAPSGWTLDRISDPDLIARLDAAGDEDTLAGIPISSLLHEACMSSGCGLN